MDYIIPIIKETVDKIVLDEALSKSIIILSNAEKCMIELQKYIHNHEQVYEQLQFLIDKHIFTEEYEKCSFFIEIKSMYDRQILHFKRMLQGLPAFEETKTQINEENNRQDQTSTSSEEK